MLINEIHLCKEIVILYENVSNYIPFTFFFVEHKQKNRSENFLTISNKQDWNFFSDPWLLDIILLKERPMRPD